MQRVDRVPKGGMQYTFVHYCRRIPRFSRGANYSVQKSPHEYDAYTGCLVNFLIATTRVVTGSKAFALCAVTSGPRPDQPSANGDSNETWI